MKNKIELMSNENISTLGTKEEANEIVFSTGGTPEIIKLCANGDIFVKDKLIENDKEVVDAMREFLRQSYYL